MKTIHKLVGIKHRGTTHVVSQMKAGHLLTLKREPTNEYDPNAVQVIDADTGQMIGYIEAKSNASLARAMDSGVTPHAVLAITADRWPHVEVTLLTGTGNRPESTGQ